MAGRPLIGTEPMKARQVRMTDAEWEKCKTLGGAEWIRENLSKVTQDEAAEMAATRRLEKHRKRSIFVYTHAYQGTVFYVGRGSYARARPGLSRNAGYREFVSRVGVANVVVEITECRNEIAADALEFSLIRKHAGPMLLNIVHNKYAVKPNARDRL